MTSLKLRRLHQEIRKAFFRISDDGLLIYDDPAIGRLHHPATRLRVRCNAALVRLELLQADAVLDVFGLEPNAAEACRRAAGAYWIALERAYRRPVQGVAA